MYCKASVITGYSRQREYCEYAENNLKLRLC